LHCGIEASIPPIPGEKGLLQSAKHILSSKLVNQDLIFLDDAKEGLENLVCLQQK